MKKKLRTTRFITFCLVVVVVVLIAFSTVFAIDALTDTSTDEQYYILKQLDVSEYREGLTVGDYKEPDDVCPEGYIFAGWFTEKTCKLEEALPRSITTGIAYAKFVPADILGLKVQVSSNLSNEVKTDDTTGNIRFVTSVDSMNYSSVGFKIKRGNGAVEDRASDTVYDSLYAVIGTEGDVLEKYLPEEVFNENSTHFKVWFYKNVPDEAFITDIEVTPYWTTLDGTTVTGETSIKTVNQQRSWEYVFVDDSGSDETGVGTLELPYKTLNNALGKMQTYLNLQKDAGVEVDMSSEVYIKSALTIAPTEETATIDRTLMTWDEHDLDVTITSAKDTFAVDDSQPEDIADTATIDFSKIFRVHMHDSVTFDRVNLKLYYDTDTDGDGEDTDLNGTFYAFGNRLEITSECVVDEEHDVAIYGGGYNEAVESTNVTVYAGSYRKIYGGGWNADVTGDTHVYLAGVANADVNHTNDSNTHTVYGGGSTSANDPKGIVHGDTYVTLTGNAKASYVRGGGYLTDVEGTCYVNFEGDAKAHGINGAGDGGAVNNTFVVMEGGETYQVFGGVTSNGGTVNNTNVHILGGTVNRRVYGGSYNETNALGTAWGDTRYHVDGYSSVTVGGNAKLLFDDANDKSFVALSRYETVDDDEIGVMILNPGMYDKYSSNLGFKLQGLITTADTPDICAHFLVNVEGEGTVTSESGVLRIKPTNAGAYATVTEPNGDTVVIKGEGTYSLSGLTKKDSVQTIEVTFSDSVSEEPSGDYVLSYGDNSNSYFNTLTDAMAAVSTPSIDGTQKTATITIGVPEVTVDSTFSLTDGDNVVLQNTDGVEVTIKRGTNDAMFNVASGCSLTIGGTIVVDGNGTNILGPAMISNAGSFTLTEGATLQNANTITSTDDAENSVTYNGSVLYIDGTTAMANIYGSVKNNTAYNGGAIYIANDAIVNMYATTTIEGNNSTNAGGAIYVNRGTLNANETTFQSNNASGDGGAIYVNGYFSSVEVLAVANLNGCTFSENTSVSGGAVNSKGIIIVDNCTFIGQTASSNGGAICIYNALDEAKPYFAVAKITNSTFTNNTAKNRSGAIDVNGGQTGDVSVAGCEFDGNNSSEGNGATITVNANGESVAIKNSIFSGNSEGNRDVILLNRDIATAVVSGTITGAEFKYNKNGAIVQVNGTLDEDSDITLTPASSLYVEGYQVLGTTGSATEKQLTNAAEIVKLTSVSGEHWYITSEGKLSNVVATIEGIDKSYTEVKETIESASGAVEVEFVRSIDVSKAISVPSGADVTIKNTAGEDIILTRSDAITLFDVVAGGKLTIGSNEKGSIVIDGGSVYDDASNKETGLATTVSMIKNAGEFVLEANATLQNANAGTSSSTSLGGALYSAGQATINGKLEGNRGYDGGAVYIAYTGHVEATYATFASNIASHYGGAIYVERKDGTDKTNGLFEGENCTFDSNQASRGGALFMTAYGSLSENEYKQGAILTMNDSKIEGFVNNKATTHGGAIWVDRGTMTISGYVFKGNEATTNGGAIYVNQYNKNKAELTISNCTFGGTSKEDGNTAKKLGGAIYSAGNLNVEENSSFVGNTAGTNGGAISIFAPTSTTEGVGRCDTQVVSISNVTFTSNTAERGGAIDVEGGTTGKVEMTNCSFDNNSSTTNNDTINIATGETVTFMGATFEGTTEGEAAVVNLQADDASIGQAIISGKLTGVEFKYDANDAQVVIAGDVDSESNITVTPNKYSEGLAVIGMTGSATTEHLKAAAEIMNVTPDEEDSDWYINHEGKLTKAFARIGETYYPAYAALKTAMEEKTGEYTVEFFRNAKATDGITIPSGATVTITNEAGKNITLTRTTDVTLFAVSEGATLTIGTEITFDNASTVGSFIVDGGSVYDVESSTENGLQATSSLISNAGTFNLKSNATLQNSNTGIDSGNKTYGGALNTSGSATIDGTLKNNRAYQGGAIYINRSEKVLLVETSATANIEYNYAAAGGAVYVNVGILKAEGTTFSYNNSTTNGGAIVSNYNTGYIDLTGCTINNNTSTQSGGAIYARYELKVDGCTFEYNKAGTSGGAICIYDNTNTNATTNITNSTFTGNESATRGSAIEVNGAESEAAPVTISGCTFSANHDAGNNSTIQVQADSDPSISSCTFEGNRNEEVDRIYLNNSKTTLSISGKIANVEIANVTDSKIIVNGEIDEESHITITPSTAMYLEGTQILIAGETVTQEQLAAAASIIEVAPFEGTYWHIDSEGQLARDEARIATEGGYVYFDTLSDALKEAKAGVETTIEVIVNTEVSETLAIAGGQNVIIKNIEDSSVMITRTFEGSMFTVDAESTLTLQSDSSTSTLTLDGGNSADVELVAPALVSNSGTFTLGANTTIQNANSGATETVSLGGAFYNSGTAYVYGIFDNNMAYHGGAIYNAGSNANVIGGACIFSNNGADYSGGAIYLESGSIELKATENGMGAFTSNKITSSTVSKHNAGAIYVAGGTLVIDWYEFESNKANANSGAIHLTSSQNNVISNCTFTSNQTGRYEGGAIGITGKVDIKSCTFKTNAVAVDTGAEYGGAAIYVNSTKGVVVDDCTFISNIASKGGSSIYVNEKAKVEIVDGDFTSETGVNSIYLETGVRATISGDIKGATIKYTDADTAQVLVGGDISSESTITITLAEYNEGDAVIAKADDTITDVQLATAAKCISVADANYYVSFDGVLLPVDNDYVAQVGTSYYAEVDVAIKDAIATLADADSTATVYVLQDETMDESVTVSTGTLVVTNAPGKDVKLTRAIESSLFIVDSGSALQIGANTSGSMIVDGGYVSTDTSTTIIPSLIQNAGTLVVNENVTIQNANTRATSDPGTSKNAYKAGALFNTGTATLSGNFTGNTGYNGGAIYGSGGTITITGGSYSYNNANYNGGVIAGSSEVTIKAGTFQNNNATQGGGVFYLGANLEIQGGTYHTNKAKGASGGVIYCNKKITITGGTFYGNNASTLGGVVNVAESAEISGVTMYGNTAGTANGGSAIYVSSDKTLKLTGCNIYNNETCDIRFYNAKTYGNATITDITADDGNASTTERCYIYTTSSEYYAIPEQE